VKWLSMTRPRELTVKFDTMSPCAPANAPSPPVTTQMTAPRCHPAIGAGSTVPRPTVAKKSVPARP
jgi:hypothetical protein